MTPKQVVLDDDPTGTQTVTGVPVLTQWSAADLDTELLDPGPAVFLLTNSRALAPVEADQLARQIGLDLAASSARTGRPIRVISRSDSTLRGHFPGEVEALMQGLGGEFDGIILCPFFAEGGRLTRDGIHYVVQGDNWTPVGESEFAQDRAFGFRSSRLTDWVREKSPGSHRAAVAVAPGDDLSLRSAPHGAVLCLEAASEAELREQIDSVKAVEAEGRRFVFRTAASWVAADADIAALQLVSPSEIVGDTRNGGLIVVGSYVSKTTQQLEELRQLGLIEIVLTEADLSDRHAQLTKIELIDRSIARGESVVLSTFRDRSRAGDLDFGQVVSATVVDLVKGLTQSPAYLITKGGITSSDVVVHGLDIRRGRVLGPALPGVPVWKADAGSKWPGLSVVIFPGNVGSATSLLELVQALESERSPT